MQVVSADPEHGINETNITHIQVTSTYQELMISETDEEDIVVGISPF